jgi:Domain of unknown function (DUF1996)
MPHLDTEESDRLMRIWLLLVPLIPLLIVSTEPAQGTGMGGEWITTCPYSHTSMADPIVYPRQPGASHVHDFEGNKTTNAFSTPKKLRATATDCEDRSDHAAYWIPRLLVGGVPKHPSDFQNYYVATVTNVNAIKPYPRALVMLAGNSHATHPQPTSIVYWGCGDGSGVGTKNFIPDCRGVSGKLYLHIIFPSCWDGIHADSPNHRSHMAYPTDADRCPRGHSIPVPGLIERVTWNPAPDPAAVTLSSGSYITIHGDFMNGWFNHDVRGHGLADLIKSCLVTGIECGKPAP